jgi:integrase/recombinase XerD
LNFDSDLEDFKAFLNSEKGVSPHTLSAYLFDVRSFMDFLKQRNVQQWESVQLEILISFLSTLREKKYASSSVYRKIMSLKVFFRFLKREHLLSNSEIERLQGPKIWQTVPDTLTLDEVQLILKQPDINTFDGARDKAILELLYAAGIRVGELCLLTLYDVDDSFIRVTGKGKKERLVPIGHHAIAAIDYYLVHFRDHFENEKELALFLMRSGKRVDRMTIWKAVKEYTKKAGIQKNIFPHSFRHTFATHLLDNGADVRVIQELLGHEDISTTERYTHLSQKKLKESFYKCTPTNNHYLKKGDTR